MRTWNPIRALSHAARNAPWIVMAVALHAIVLVALSIWYVAKERPKPAESPIVIHARPPIDRELPPEDIAPIEIVRNNIPDNVEERLIKLDEVYIPTFADVPTDPDVTPGDPTAQADLPLGNTTGGGAIGVFGGCGFAAARTR